MDGVKLKAVQNRLRSLMAVQTYVPISSVRKSLRDDLCVGNHVSTHLYFYALCCAWILMPVL